MPKSYLFSFTLYPMLRFDTYEIFSAIFNDEHYISLCSIFLFSKYYAAGMT